MTKKCSKCEQDKLFDDFHKAKTKKDGIFTICKACTSENKKKYYIENKQLCNKRKAEWVEKNKERHTAYLASNRKEYYLNNKDVMRAKHKEWVLKNKEKNDIYHKEYRKNNRLKANEYEKNRILSDVGFKLSKTLRSRLRSAIKNNQKSGSAIENLGCAIDELRAYLESKFELGMNWGNHSFAGWHIDHIKPLASFDLTNPEQLKIACHYSNLQPLWALPNMKKGSKTNGEKNV